jgi:membrane-associated phospholipid phosphatase
MRRWWLLKLVGVTAVTWLFFIGYFYLLRNPVHAITVMPLTALDHAIPFQPEALVVYLSLWFYVGCAPGLQLRFIELLVYGAWVGALCVTGLALFYFFPTEVPLAMRQNSDFPGFNLLQGVDAAGNACPSMHVAVAIFSAVGLHQVLRTAGTPTALRLLNGLWCAAIIYSTLAVKQHVVLDVVAGALLAAPFAWAAQRWKLR